MSATPDAWQAARRAFEAGAASVSDIARDLGVSHQAVSKRRNRERWHDPADGVDRRNDDERALDALMPARVAPPPQAPTGPYSERDDIPAPDTPPTPPPPATGASGAPGDTTAIGTWVQRAATEATAAGLTAAAIRMRLLADIRDRNRPLDAPTVRALSQAYGIFIDRAQLLAGDPTTILGAATLTAEDRQARVIAIVAEAARRREAAAAAAIETTASEP